MSRKNIFTLVVCLLLSIIIFKNIYAMIDKNADTHSSLRKWLTIIEIASLIAVGSTIILGGAALVIRKKLDTLEQIEKIKLELEIQQTIEKADSATAIAEQARLGQKEAELKEKEIELELERLKISVMDRVLPSDKIPSIRTILDKRRGERISFSALSSDIEAVNYMTQLANLFKSCGWEVNTQTPILYGKPIPPGIEISIKSKDFESRGEDVIRCFNEMGVIPNNFFLISDLKDELEVIVGPKERKQQE